MAPFRQNYATMRQGIYTMALQCRTIDRPLVETIQFGFVKVSADLALIIADYVEVHFRF
jgi:hypothetical protein